MFSYTSSHFEVKFELELVTLWQASHFVKNPNPKQKVTNVWKEAQSDYLARDN
jgi:hypothetical protein